MGLDNAQIYVEFERRASGEALIRITGSLDAFTKDTFRDQLAILFQEGHPAISLDMSGVRYLDSTGVAGLLRAWTNARERGRHIEMINPSAHVERVLTLLGMQSMFLSAPKSGDK